MAQPFRHPQNPDSQDPTSRILHALRIINLHIVNLRIIPSRRSLVDIKVSLNLPRDTDHRAIGAVVRNQNLNLGRPRLHLRPAGNTASPGPSAPPKRIRSESGVLTRK